MSDRRSSTSWKASEVAALTPALFARRTCLTIGGALAVAIPLYAVSLDYVVEREIWLQRATGWCALGALLLALSMTPLRYLHDRDRMPCLFPLFIRGLV